MAEKIELKTWIKEQGSEHRGDSTTIEGGLQDLFKYLGEMDWQDFEDGFRKYRIEQFVFQATGSIFKVTIGISPQE